jgi:hypothetical protein
MVILLIGVSIRGSDAHMHGNIWKEDKAMETIWFLRRSISDLGDLSH